MGARFKPNTSLWASVHLRSRLVQPWVPGQSWWDTLVRPLGAAPPRSGGLAGVASSALHWPLANPQAKVSWPALRSTNVRLGRDKQDKPAQACLEYLLSRVNLQFRQQRHLGYSVPCSGADRNTLEQLPRSRLGTDARARWADVGLE